MFLKSSSILTILRMSLAFEHHHFNVDALWSAPCIDVHTIIQRSLLLTSLNNMALLSIFPSFTFLSFTFLFNVFCFSSLVQRVVLLNFLDTKVYPNSLLFFTERGKERDRQTERLRERESRRSPVLRGWSGGAMVAGKLSVPGRLTDLDVGQGRIALA